MKTRSADSWFSRYVTGKLLGSGGRPLSLYALLALLALLTLLLLHTVLAFLIPPAVPSQSVVVLNLVFAGLYALALSILTAALGLYLWLQIKPLALFATLAAAGLWVIGILGFGQAAAWIALVSIVAFGLVVALGLRIASPSLLPLSDRSQRRGALGFLRDYIQKRNRLGQVVSESSQGQGEPQVRVTGNQRSRVARGPGFILTGCHHAVALSNGLEFRGVKSPGLVFTGRRDQVMQALDLRPQRRDFEVEALTKDGINITVRASASFRIDAGHRQPRLGEHLPFRKSAAFKALYAQRVEHHSGESGSGSVKQCRWDSLPSSFGRRILQDIISGYTFDGLYGLYQATGQVPREAIAQAFCSQLAGELKSVGIQLMEGSIGNLEPSDPHVYLERARNWQSEWQRKIMLEQAEGQAEWLRLVESARAEAQAELVMDLGRRLKRLNASREELRPERILNQLLNTLEGLAGKPRTKGVLPPETKQAMTEIREDLDEIEE